MRLAATLLVRDEEQILGAHLDYHLAQGVDLFLVMDNGSIDATPEILREYERMGAVRIVPGAEPGHYRQGEWVTKLARLAATEYGADWVLNLDADEFWWPNAGTLPDALASVPDRYGVLHAARIDFDPVPDSAEPFRTHDGSPEGAADALGNRGLPRVAQRGHQRAEVVTGNHARRPVVDAVRGRKDHARQREHVGRHGDGAPQISWWACQRREWPTNSQFNRRSRA